MAAVKQFREANSAYDVNFHVERDKAITAAAETGEEWHTDAVNLRLGTGNIGVMAAINDTVRAS